MSDWRTRTVDLDGPVRVVDHGGHGPPFVCLHGLGGSAMDWQAIAPVLATRGRVLALDLPGFGDSPLARRSSTVADLAGLLARFLSEHVGEPAVVLGNSMGGMVALLHAAAHPGSVARLVLLSPTLPASLRRLPHPLVMTQFLMYAVPVLGEWFVRTRRRGVGTRRLVDASLTFMAARPERIPPRVYEERYALADRLAARPDSDEAFLRTARSLLSMLARPGRYRRLIAQIRTPTLVVHGEDDRLVSVRAARAVARARPDWTVEVLSGVGHVPQLEVPDEVGELVLRWLGSAALSAGSAIADEP